MKIQLLVIGKTDKKYIAEGIEEYQKRLKHYVNFNLNIIPDIKNSKNMSSQEQKSKEGELILSKLSKSSILILLDENGKQFSSVEFSKQIEKMNLASYKELVFVIGGPYGFSKDVYERADRKISLSKMTFSHQMVRMIFVEQLYRAYTIINNEPYHHI
ncbi:MAG: 23S rRNA (pseudouridine(1915)-N(3))-methyltransferase RlmH [Marinifilaceae bacterium]|jgi:23S rRNA (pseudouridine1915-N3)-methyltransferase|nr:23S rRNA (pseudouridine(1915)-N(3))-methyltransferase RlmH [Marinifilaceae bacterium]